MISNNYKKIAIIDIGEKIVSQISSGEKIQNFEIDIPLQINFKPTKYYINAMALGNINEDRGHGLCDLDTEYLAWIVGGGGSEAFHYTFSVNNNKLNIKLDRSTTTAQRTCVGIYKIIAIE